MNAPSYAAFRLRSRPVPGPFASLGALPSLLCRLYLLSAALLGNGSLAAPPIEIRGRWILNQDGQPTPPVTYTRGLQTSGLVYRAGSLWSVGDQRSRYPGHLLEIDPQTGRLKTAPLKLTVPPGGTGEFDRYRAIPNSDFEGLTAHPSKAGVLYAVTEDKVPWLVEIHQQTGKAATTAPARIVRLTPLRFPPELEPWRGSHNFRFEGITSSDDGETLYLAFERAKDDQPRVFSLTSKEIRGTPVQPKLLPFAFEKVARRGDKGSARLNLNGLQFVRQEKKAYLLAIARDQERILVLDLASHTVARVVDLDLRAPDGQRVHWVSPEAVAADRASDRLWIINDPDSVRGNYRARADKKATGPFADFTPLLFEVRLRSVLPDP